MSDKPFGSDEIAKQSDAFLLRDRLDKFKDKWMDPNKARDEETRASDEGRRTIAQTLQNRVSELGPLQMSVKKDPNDSFARLVYNSSIDDLRSLARSLNPEEISSKMSRNMAENIESQANKHGISFFTGNGTLVEEK